MWDGVHVRNALFRVFAWLFSTLRCFSNYLPPNPHPQESRLPVAVTNGGNHHSSGGLLFQIRAALSQVNCWLTSTVHVFLNYFNVSPVYRHNGPQVVPDHQASSHQHQIKILNSTVHVFFNLSPVHRHNGPQVIPYHQASSQHQQINVLNPISHHSNHVREASNHTNPTTLLSQCQMVIGLIVSITGLILNEDKSLTVLQSTFIKIVLSVAFAATFGGMFLEALEWICWLCFALSCVPPLLEASQDFVPLLLVAVADCPSELRDAGANQLINQICMVTVGQHPNI